MRRSYIAGLVGLAAVAMLCIWAGPAASASTVDDNGYYVAGEAGGNKDTGLTTGTGHAPARTVAVSVTTVAGSFDVLQAAVDATGDTVVLAGRDGWYAYGPASSDAVSVAAMTDADGMRHVELLADITHVEADVHDTITVSGSLSVDLRGFTIDADSAGATVTVSNGAVLHVYDTDDAGATRPLESAGKITGGANDTHPGAGGGINAFAGNSQVHLHGGSVTGNHAMWGGGIEVGAGSTFVVDGGYVTENVATVAGGGVNLDACRMEMSNGQISGNTTRTGGGINTGSSGTTILLSGGLISDNEAAANGGGIYVRSDCHVEMSGGTISGNTGGSGGGFCVDSPYSMAEVRLLGGYVSGNVAREGGGIFAQKQFSVIVDGGHVDGNTSEGRGGGIYADGWQLGVSSVKILAGSVQENHASAVGGIFAYDVDLFIGRDTGDPPIIRKNFGKGIVGGILFSGISDASVEVKLDIWPTAVAASNHHEDFNIADAENLLVDNPRAVVDLHRDASFWYEDSLSYKMKFTQYARITPAFPFASTDDLVAHEVPLDSSGHVSVMMFDYMTDRDGSVRSDLRSSSNGGINAGHSFKFLGGIWDEATDEGRFVNLTSGAGLWAPRLIDGFPLLDERFPIRDSAAELPESLKYLVDGNPIEGMKRVYRSTNTMLSQEGRWFEFDSTRNFATFVVDGESGGAGTGHFVVYDAPGIRDAYTVGQFFPFAPIDKVFGVREADGKTVLFPNYGSDSRNDCSSREFASGHGYFKANHHFGMVMDVDFLQPAAGRLYSRDETTGEWFAEDMVFEFDGDDDLYVYIDGVLVLDVGGVHASRHGLINFANGRVSASSVKAVAGTPGAYFNGTIRELFELALGDEFDPSAFSGDTFSPMSKHHMTVYYFERGNMASNLGIRFNLQEEIPVTLSKADAATSAPLSGARYSAWTSPECVGDPLYTSLPSAEDGTMVFEGSFTKGTYWIKETTAPTLYGLDEQVYRLEVLDGGACELYDRAEGGSRIVGFVDDRIASYAILPKTGGPGVAVFLLPGAVMVLAVAVLTERRRRR